MNRYLSKSSLLKNFTVFIIGLVVSGCGLDFPNSLSNSDSDLARLSGLWYYESPGSSQIEFESETSGDVDINGDPITLPDNIVFRNYIQFSGTERFSYWSEAYNNGYGINPLTVGGLQGGVFGIIYSLNLGRYIYNPESAVIEAYRDSFSNLSGTGPNIDIPVFETKIICGLPNNGLFFDNLQINSDTLTFTDRAHTDADCNPLGETITATRINDNFSADLVYPDAVKIVVSGDAFGAYDSSEILSVIVIVDETNPTERILFGFAGDAVRDNEYNIEFFIPATFFGGSELYVGAIVGAETDDWELAPDSGIPASDGVAFTFGEVASFGCDQQSIGNFTAVSPDDGEVTLHAQSVVEEGSVSDYLADTGAFTCE